MSEKPKSRQKKGITAGGRPYSANQQGKHISVSVGDFAPGTVKPGQPHKEYTKGSEIKNGERVSVKATRGLDTKGKPLGRQIVKKGPTTKLKK